MIRSLMTFALVAVVLGGCARESDVPQAVAVAMSAPQEAADKEVLIATQPSGAKILLKGAEVGATPMKLLIRGDTNVVLEKEGYVRQALMLTPKSDPNVVITLVPGEGGAVTPPVAAEPDPASAASSQKASGKSSKKPDKAGDKPEEGATDPKGGAGTTGTGGTAATETAPPPEATPPPTAAPKKTEYTTMRQIKDALRAGKITKPEYSSWQAIIRQKRQAEFDATRRDLEEHKITKAQYEEKIRAIKIKYEG